MSLRVDSVDQLRTRIFVVSGVTTIEACSKWVLGLCLLSCGYSGWLLSSWFATLVCQVVIATTICAEATRGVVGMVKFTAVAEGRGSVIRSSLFIAPGTFEYAAGSGCWS